MTVSEDDVRRVAKLARLSLEPQEVTELRGDLQRIVAHIDELEQVDTSDVPPTAGLSVAAPLRADQVISGLSPEQALGEAPRVSGGGFAVPGFVDER
jgi:aspartyl-tRNA(Asn)/glutamyl-tRNA(Gln) amidotransferase subunit C